MSGILRPLTTDQERRADPQAEQVRRAAVAIGVVTHPPIAAVAAIVGVALSRQTRVRPRIYVPIAAVIFTAVLLTGWLPAYYQPVVYVAQAVLADPSDVSGTVVGAVATHWLGWLIGGLPFAAAAGALVGALWAWWRSRRRATWRETPEHEADTPERRVHNALAHLDQWPESAAPTKIAQGAGKANKAATVHDVRDQAVRLGVTMQGRPVSVEVTVGELGYHGSIFGPTGFGKTTLLQELATGVVEATAMDEHKNPLVMVNMKPDPDLARTLAGMAAAAGRRFWHITHDGNGSGQTYNPLVSGTPYQIASGIMEAEAHASDGGFSEAHYRRAGERFARFAARALDQLNRADPERWPREYASLARLLSVTILEDHTDRYDAALAADWARFVKEIDANPEIKKWIGGIGMRIAAAAEGGARTVLLDRSDSLNLAAALMAGDVVLFDLDAAEDAGASRLVGNLAIQDLTFALARLGEAQWQWHLDEQGQPIRDQRNEKIQRRHCQIIIDEFGALGGSLVYNLFQRSRGYGAGLLLSAQDTGSLDQAGEWFRATVINNSNVLATFAQSTDAEFFAGLVGTRKALEESHQIFEDGTWLTDNVYRSGQGNLREVDQYVLHPNTLRNLGRGHAIIRVRTRAGQSPLKVAIRRTAESRHFHVAWPPNDGTTLTTHQRQALAVAPAREYAALKADMTQTEPAAATGAPIKETAPADEDENENEDETSRAAGSEETDNPWITAATAGDAGPRRRTAPRPPTRMIAVRDRDRSQPEPAKQQRRRPTPRSRGEVTPTVATDTEPMTNAEMTRWRDDDAGEWPPDMGPWADSDGGDWPPD